jgi:hypothetical protein
MEAVYHITGMCHDHMFHFDLIDAWVIFMGEQGNMALRYINSIIKTTKLWLG